MTLREEVDKAVNDILTIPLKEENGIVVPTTDTVALKDGAKLIDATYVYADLADSTGLAHKYKKFAAAKVIRTYLTAATRILKASGGEIRSFDGDRVMAIFIGKSKNTSAIDGALKLNYAITKILNPALQEQWTDFKWTMSHGVGIDTGEAMIVRGGVRGDNDLVSIGQAPNVAAKLSEKRGRELVNITSNVYENMANTAKLSGDKNMWTSMGFETYGGKTVAYYGSSWIRRF